MNTLTLIETFSIVEETESSTVPHVSSVCLTKAGSPIISVRGLDCMRQAMGIA